jgi:hypothetical protein
MKRTMSKEILYNSKERKAMKKEGFEDERV